MTHSKKVQLYDKVYFVINLATLQNIINVIENYELLNYEHTS